MVSSGMILLIIKKDTHLVATFHRAVKSPSGKKGDITPYDRHRCQEVPAGGRVARSPRWRQKHQQYASTFDMSQLRRAVVGKLVSVHPVGMPSGKQRVPR